MKKILLTGVNGNFGARAARVLLDRYPHEGLIFTSSRPDGLKRYKDLGIETRIADFNNCSFWDLRQAVSCSGGLPQT